MRILFVEDEEDKLISTITKVFTPSKSEIGDNPLLHELDEKIKQINTFAGDDYDCREDIKKLFFDCPFLNVEYDFLDALKLIESEDVKKYDLFILDRNLEAKEGLTPEEFKNASPDSTDDDYTYICNKGEFGREGDYLLMRLYARFKDNLCSRFCFYSGYPNGEVFDNNRFLKDNVGEGKLITKNDYIDKGASDKYDQLRDFIHRDYEAVQIYKKWGRVLFYYDKTTLGPDARRAIVSALKMNSCISSKKKDYTDTIKQYDNAVNELKKYYCKLFEPSISKQKKEFEIYRKQLEANRYNDKRKTDEINKWRSKAAIPQNIVNLSLVMPYSRNICEHDDDPNVNVDMSGLTVLACAYALLEITRFWLDNNMDEKQLDSMMSSADTSGNDR